MSEVPRETRTNLYRWAVHAKAAYSVSWDSRNVDRSELIIGDGTGARVFATMHRGRILLAFTGTQPKDLRDWWTNAQAWAGSRHYRAGVAHSGFLDAYDSIRVPLHLFVRRCDHVTSFEVCGHSNGGALALIAANDFQQEGWSPSGAVFGTPAMFSRAAVAKYSAPIFDVVNARDPVPILPQAVGWNPVGTRICITRRGHVVPDPNHLHYLRDWCARGDGLLSIAPHKIERYAEALR